MNEIPDIYGCPLWADFTEDELSDLISGTRYTVISHKKGDIIVTQGDICKYLYILAKGSVRTEMFTEEGGTVTIANIPSPHPLASAFLFADNNRFPVDVIAEEDCAVMRIPKDEVLRMFTIYPKFLSRYIAFNSNITSFLSSKLQLMTIRTIKGKLAWYLCSLIPKTSTVTTRNIIVKPDMNQTELARFFGVARPSLARTISEMERDNLIKTGREGYTIINVTTLKESIQTS